jgi:hypothetical protein
MSCPKTLLVNSRDEELRNTGAMDVLSMMQVSLSSTVLAKARTSPPRGALFLTNWQFEMVTLDCMAVTIPFRKH